MEYDIEYYSSLRGGTGNLRAAPDSIFTSAHRCQSSAEPCLRCQSCSGDYHDDDHDDEDDEIMVNLLVLMRMMAAYVYKDYYGGHCSSLLLPVILRKKN